MIDLIFTAVLPALTLITALISIAIMFVYKIFHPEDKYNCNYYIDIMIAIVLLCIALMV